jgi:hypothetical protein
LSFLENIKLCSRRLWENIQTLFNKGLTGVERTGVLAVSGGYVPESPLSSSGCVTIMIKCLKNSAQRKEKQSFTKKNIRTN